MNYNLMHYNYQLIYLSKGFNVITIVRNNKTNTLYKICIRVNFRQGTHNFPLIDFVQPTLIKIDSFGWETTFQILSVVLSLSIIVSKNPKTGRFFFILEHREIRNEVIHKNLGIIFLGLLFLNILYKRKKKKSKFHLSENN